MLWYASYCKHVHLLPSNQRGGLFLQRMLITASIFFSSEQAGVHVSELHTTVYAGHVRWLPEKHPLRAQYAQRAHPMFRHLAHVGAPAPRTSDSILALGRYGSESPAKAKEAGWLGVSPLLEVAIDACDCIRHDVMHAFANVGTLKVPCFVITCTLELTSSRLSVFFSSQPNELLT